MKGEGARREGKEGKATESKVSWKPGTNWMISPSQRMLSKRMFLSFSSLPPCRQFPELLLHPPPPPPSPSPPHPLFPLLGVPERVQQTMEWQDSFGLGIGAVTHAVNLTVLEEVSVYAAGSLFWNRNLAATVAIQGRRVCLQID